MGYSHIWTPELCQSGQELFPWMTLLHLCCQWTFLILSGASEGRKHITIFLYFDSLAFFPSPLCQMWEKLFTPLKSFWGKSWKIQLTHDWVWVITAEQVSPSPWPDSIQAAYPLLGAPGLIRNHLPRLKETFNKCRSSAPETYLSS